MATYAEKLAAGVEKLKTMPINIDGNIVNPNIKYGDLFGQESLAYALSQDDVDPDLAYALRTKLDANNIHANRTFKLFIS